MNRRFFVPEVIQTSAMDCGPASLKALFGGFGQYLSYGRLREVCQTDVDGTSIDTLEDVAHQLGLDVEQRMMPADVLLLDASRCVPALVVVRLPGGATHVVVLWRVHGRLVQVMDPAGGRVWMPRQRFLASLYVHDQTVERAAWHEWSQSASFTAGLDDRMHALGVTMDLWADRAHLDAALRLAHVLMNAGALKRGREARAFLGLCAANPEQIPAEYWSARTIDDDAERVNVRGAVLVTASGLRTNATREPLPESLAAVRSEPPPRAWTPVFAAVRAGGWVVPAIIVLALLIAAAGTVFEMLLFRGLFDVARHLTLTGQRLGACTSVIVFLSGLLALEWPASRGLLRLGRHLELRLRNRFLWKIPRLSERYFQSRLISDMAFRAHTLHILRQLPELAGRFVRSAASLLLTAAAIAWLYPGAAWPAWIVASFALGVPLLFHPTLIERDLRFREIGGALSRFYLDALIGSRAIDAHGAERTLRAAQAPQLERWADAGLRQQALLVHAETAQTALTLAPIVWLVYGQSALPHGSAGLLLLVYWALSMPASGRQVASIIWSLPALRNTLLRFLEPLGSPEETMAEAPPVTSNRRGVRVNIEEATVIAGGHVILDRVSLHVAPREHVGIVGLSGSGKSSLVGLLLGWHQPAHGRVRVDDAVLDAKRLAHLRAETAWVDSQVHLFQTTLFENLRYGNGDDAANRIDVALEDGGLMKVLERWPDGLQTCLGEGGTLVAGGEGQRVRIGRALGRTHVRLAILDEPARGFDRDERRRFLAAARRRFADATVFFITHDVRDTLDFDRVVVLEQGRIIEHGPPRELWATAASRYRALFDEDAAVQRHVWSHPVWRRLRMTSGVLSDAVGEREWTHV
jgi:ABC-type bacteriocin/lantibiotic exporter with double-glycine peptidase domain